MAASRKRPSADPAVDAAVLASLRGRRVAVGLSGGLDSVVLLHLLHRLAPRLRFRLSAIHVNHGLSPNAGDWQKFCESLCLAMEVPFKTIKVKVRKGKLGLEAAARAARREALVKLNAEVLALAHHLDDQAETVLFNLLRGTGLEGASGMPAVGALGRKRLVRPLLGTPRSAIRAYAAEHRLAWIEDESNADEALTRNFLRRRVGPLLESRFPRWKENLARAARHFATAELDARGLLRGYLKQKGLRAPSEAKLVEMLKQLGANAASVSHDGTVFRVFRGKLYPESERKSPPLQAIAWNGETRLALPNGELRFRKARGRGIDRRCLDGSTLQIRPRAGGERLRLAAGRPSRTLKNLFQEAGVPPWVREQLPLLFCGERLVWAAGLGVDAAFLAPKNAAGVVPEWRPA